MSDSERRFQLLAEQFAVLEHNLSVSENPQQRAELLKGMNTVIVIEELGLSWAASHGWIPS
jgi:hypothetical protein